MSHRVDAARRRGFAGVHILVLTAAAAVAFTAVILLINGQTEQVARLRLAGDGDPVVLDAPAGSFDGFMEVARVIEPAVVNINTTSIVRVGGGSSDELRRFFGDDFAEQFFGEPREEERAGLGSGVIVDSDGHILTNYHVIAPPRAREGPQQIAGEIEVTLHDGRSYQAEVVGVDPPSDLAVIRVDAGEDLPFAAVGDSSELEVGEWVVAVGNAFGIGKTVTHGIVSATAREVPFSGSYTGFIQTDAPINPGNSGGPLLNMRGEVVAISSFILSQSGGSQGVGFGIPSEVFADVYTQLVAEGRVERGWIGVSLNPFPLNEALAEYLGIAGDDPEGIRDGDGVVVSEILDQQGEPATSGPAYEAGIRPGDVIVRFGGREIEAPNDLRAAVAQTEPGEQVEVTVVRRGEVFATRLTVARRTIGQVAGMGEAFSFEEQKDRSEQIGMAFRDLAPQEANALGLDGGVLVTDVTAGGMASEAGLESGMIITEVRGETVDSAGAFQRIIEMMPSGEVAALEVLMPLPSGPAVGYTAFEKP